MSTKLTCHQLSKEFEVGFNIILKPHHTAHYFMILFQLNTLRGSFERNIFLFHSASHVLLFDEATFTLHKPARAMWGKKVASISPFLFLYWTISRKTYSMRELPGHVLSHSSSAIIHWSPTSWISISIAILGFEEHTAAITVLIDTLLRNLHMCAPAVFIWHLLFVPFHRSALRFFFLWTPQSG